MNDDTKEAIARARGHLDAALRESLEAIRALIEAARATGGLGEGATAGFADEVKSLLDGWITSLEEGHAFLMPRAIIEPLEVALQAEIARWEKRSATDETARPVLRAFLGLRELLWEMGMRSGARPDGKTPESRRTQEPQAPETDSASSESNRSEKPRSGPRVQRFNVED